MFVDVVVLALGIDDPNLKFVVLARYFASADEDRLKVSTMSSGQSLILVPPEGCHFLPYLEVLVR